MQMQMSALLHLHVFAIISDKFPVCSKRIYKFHKKFLVLEYLAIKTLYNENKLFLTLFVKYNADKIKLFSFKETVWSSVFTKSSIEYCMI